MLPSSALPIFQAMQCKVGPEAARAMKRPSQIQGVVAGGSHYIYAPEDPRRHELHDRANIQHLQQHPTSTTSTLANSQSASGDYPTLTASKIQQVAQSASTFNDMCQRHTIFVNKLYRSMIRGFMRYVGRRPNMHLKTWRHVIQAAKERLKRAFMSHMQTWHSQQQGIQYVPEPSSNLIEAQLSFLKSFYQHRYPSPAAASADVQEEFRRRACVLAMLKQKNVLQDWEAQLIQTVSVQDGERYRKEGDCILDFWTGNTEDFATFNERNERENTGLNAEMLPLAAQAPTIESQSQQQNETTVQGQALPPAGEPATKSLPQDQGQQESPDRARMQEKAKGQPQAQGQEQTQTNSQVQLQTIRQEQSESQNTTHKHGLGQEKARGQEEMSVQVQESRHEQIDTEMSHSVQAQLLSQDRVGLDATQPIESQKPVQEQGPGHAHESPQKPSQIPALEDFQAQLQAAAQYNTQQSTQSRPETSSFAFDHEPMEEVERGRIQEQEGTRGAQQDLQATTTPEVMPVQQHVWPQAQISSELQRQAPRIALTQEQSGTVLQGLNQAGLKHSQEPPQLQAQSQVANPSESHNINPVSTDSQEVAMQDIEHVQPHELLQLAMQGPCQPQEPDRMDIERQMPQTALTASQKIQAEFEGLTDVQGDSDELGPSDTPVEPAEVSRDAGHESEDLDAIEEPAASDHEDATPSQPSKPQPEEAEPSAHLEMATPANPPIPGTRCHHCTRSKTKCNGERPCQFCLRYGKMCYDLNQKPPEWRKRGSDMSWKNRVNKKQRKMEHDEEQVEVEGDEAQKEAQDQNVSVQVTIPDESHIEPGPAAATAAADNMEDSDSDLSETETPHSSHEHSTHPPAESLTSPSKPPSQSFKAPPKKQAPKQTTSTRERAISNVTTRAAEQKAVDDAKRSLRSLPGRKDGRKG